MEFRDLYNKKRELTGLTVKKGDPIPRGYYYVTVVIFIQNDQDKFLIQKRSIDKGGDWANTGGHPKTGESSLEGIVTEVKEELGININPNKLTLFKTVKTEDDFIDLYYLKANINLDHLVLQEEEVQGVAWFSIDEINSLIEQGQFHRHHDLMYYECLKYLKLK